MVVQSWLGAAHVIRQGTRFQVGNGKSIKVWDSPWIPTLPGFKPHTPRPSQSTIMWASELMTQDGRSWNLDLLHSLFSLSEATAISQIPISQVGSRDRLRWTHTTHGHFSVDSAYTQISSCRIASQQPPETSSNVPLEKHMWKHTWKMKVQGKLKHFLWRTYHRLLPTKDAIRRKGLPTYAICSTCGEAVETIEHMFFQCNFAQLTWKLASVNWDDMADLTNNFQHWWKYICNVPAHSTNPCSLELTVYVLWQLWKMRNDWLFNAKRLSAREVVHLAHTAWLDYAQSSAALKPPQLSYPHPPVHLPPQSLMSETVGCYQICTSSVLLKRSKQLAYGLLVFDPGGSVIHAAAVTCPPASSLHQISLEAIRAAQLLAHQKGWQHVHIRSDAQEMVSSFNHSPDGLGDLSTISKDITLLSHLFTVCYLSFIPPLDNLNCHRLACYVVEAVDAPISVTWESQFLAWLTANHSNPLVQCDLD